jgi:hypothetical protein
MNLTSHLKFEVPWSRHFVTTTPIWPIWNVMNNRWIVMKFAITITLNGMWIWKNLVFLHWENCILGVENVKYSQSFDWKIFDKKRKTKGLWSICTYRFLPVHQIWAGLLIDDTTGQGIEYWFFHQMMY